jgi:hypothetical protein
MSKNSPLSARLPHSAPQIGRRQRGHGSFKLPPLEDVKRQQLKLPQTALRGQDYEDELLLERGCRTAPASHRPLFFFPHAPSPPLTVSPESKKSPKSKRCRDAAKLWKAHCMINLNESISGNGCTPGAFSTKSVYSQTTTSTNDMPDLHLPPFSPIMGTPAASSIAGSARADVDAPRSRVNSASTPSSDSTMSRITRWRKGEKIGVGSHGCVFKALNLSNGHIFVVKESIVNDKDYEEKLKMELNICKDLVHPNIVRCLGHEFFEHHLHVYLEYISSGSLKAILSEFGPLEMDLLPKAMRHLLEGLHYLHSRSPPVVHRDIKSANVLVGLDFCLKLADFGCSKRDDTTTSFTTTGSVLWMAPEVIRGKDGGHGRKADIWSLGCVFIEMATAEKPWGDKAFDNILQAMRHIEASTASPPVPTTLPDAARDLITQCVQREPQHRPRSSQMLTHEFVQRANS